MAEPRLTGGTIALQFRPDMSFPSTLRGVSITSPRYPRAFGERVLSGVQSSKVAAPVEKRHRLGEPTARIRSPLSRLWSIDVGGGRRPRRLRAYGIQTQASPARLWRAQSCPAGSSARRQGIIHHAICLLRTIVPGLDRNAPDKHISRSGHAVFKMTVSRAYRPNPRSGPDRGAPAPKRSFEQFLKSGTGVSETRRLRATDLSCSPLE